MQPADDSTLLRDYAENHSDEAFTVYCRQLGIIYSHEIGLHAGLRHVVFHHALIERF